MPVKHIVTAGYPKLGWREVGKKYVESYQRFFVRRSYRDALGGKTEFMSEAQVQRSIHLLMQKG